MTVQELRKALEAYPDDAFVTVSVFSNGFNHDATELSVDDVFEENRPVIHGTDDEEVMYEATL